MTHLGVSIDKLVNIVTMVLKNDNNSQPFYYDRQQTAPFKIPENFSFVITDIIVNPEITSFSASQFFLAVITIDGARSFTIRCDGHTAHYPLTGGLVMPDPSVMGEIHARNTTYSTGSIEVQLLGYFVKVSTGLGVGQVFSS